MPARGSCASSGAYCSRAFTSVPAQLPAAGCTTRPAGLLMTSMASSSYTTSSAMSSPVHGSSVVSPAVSATCSPPHSLSRARGAWPCTVTCPDLIQSCNRLREYSGKSSTSTWSSRRPAAASGTVAVHCRFSVALALLTNRLSAEKSQNNARRTRKPKGRTPNHSTTGKQNDSHVPPPPYPHRPALRRRERLRHARQAARRGGGKSALSTCAPDPASRQIQRRHTLFQQARRRQTTGAFRRAGHDRAHLRLLQKTGLRGSDAHGRRVLAAISRAPARRLHAVSARGRQPAVGPAHRRHRGRAARNGIGRGLRIPSRAGRAVPGQRLP